MFFFNRNLVMGICLCDVNFVMQIYSCDETSPCRYIPVTMENNLDSPASKQHTEETVAIELQ